MQLNLQAQLNGAERRVSENVGVTVQTAIDELRGAMAQGLAGSSFTVARRIEPQGAGQGSGAGGAGGAGEEGVQPVQTLENYQWKENRMLKDIKGVWSEFDAAIRPLLPREVSLEWPVPLGSDTFALVQCQHKASFIPPLGFDLYSHASLAR